MRCIGAALFVSATLVHAQFVGPARDLSAPQSIPSDTATLDNLLTANRPPLKLLPDDQLNVVILGTPIAASVRIESDGTIALPLIGKTVAEGLTVEQLQEAIQADYQRGGFVNSPMVVVTAAQQPSAVVVVSGDVGKPGTFPGFGSHTLADYIAQAQGFKPTASWIVTLVRSSLPGPVRIPLGPDPTKSPYGLIPVYPGDEIRVPTSGMFYVLGAVRTQGSFPLNGSSPITALRGVILAGGFQLSKEAEVYVIRRQVDTHAQAIIPVDLRRVKKLKQPDIVLQPDDIVFVPTSLAKTIIRGFGTSAILSLTNTLLYTGTF